MVATFFKYFCIVMIGWMASDVLADIHDIKRNVEWLVKQHK